LARLPMTRKRRRFATIALPKPALRTSVKPRFRATVSRSHKEGGSIRRFNMSSRAPFQHATAVFTPADSERIMVPWASVAQLGSEMTSTSTQGFRSVQGDGGWQRRGSSSIASSTSMLRATPGRLRMSPRDSSMTTI
jgi:hypothetical protein